MKLVSPLGNFYLGILYHFLLINVPYQICIWKVDIINKLMTLSQS